MKAATVIIVTIILLILIGLIGAMIIRRANIRQNVDETRTEIQERLNMDETDSTTDLAAETDAVGSDETTVSELELAALESEINALQFDEMPVFSE